MSKHTPTPWSYEPDLNRVYSVLTNHCVATPHIATNHTVMEQWPDDAAFIVRACNSHDALVKAGKKVLAGLNARIQAADKDAVPVFDGIAELHTALKLAGEP